MTQNSATRRGRTIDGRTRDILTGAQIDGTHLRLTEQLTLDDYAPVKQILEALGGLWTRRLGALVFPAGTDAASLIADTLTTDGQNDPGGVLGEFSAGFSLDADQYGHSGSAVGLCCQCGNPPGPHFARLARAETYWSTHPVGSELVAA